MQSKCVSLRRLAHDLIGRSSFDLLIPVSLHLAVVCGLQHLKGPTTPDRPCFDLIHKGSFYHESLITGKMFASAGVQTELRSGKMLCSSEFPPAVRNAGPLGGGDTFA